MKKNSIFCNIFLSTLVSIPMQALLVSCSDYYQPKIVEPTSKLFYSNTTISSDKIVTDCILGMFYLENIDDPSQIVIEAKESEGTQFLGKLTPILINYYRNIYCIDLIIENNDSYAKDYNIDIAFYLNDKLIQKVSTYTIRVDTEIIQINNSINIEPKWNSDEQKIDYTLKSPLIKILHPTKNLSEQDFTVDIKFLSPEIQSAEIKKLAIKNLNELELTIDLASTNLLTKLTHYINLEITYTPSKISHYFYYDLKFESAGWDNLVDGNEKTVNISIPSEQQVFTNGYITNFVISGLGENLDAELVDMNTGEAISDGNLIKCSFVQRYTYGLPTYDLVIRVSYLAEEMENVPVKINIIGTEISFSSGYYFTSKK